MLSTILLYTATLVFLLYALITLSMIVLIIFYKDKLTPRHDLKIAVLIAARNEADNILHCLNSLAQQNYPTYLLEIHIGDDQSTDGTGAIIQAFVAPLPHFHYHYIDKTLPGLKGKQNVIAQLAHHTKADYLFITDADVVHHPDWLGLLAAGFEHPNVGCVSSGTIVAPNTLWASLQTIDWLLGIVVIKNFNRLKMSITAVGNNMAVSRSAYKAVGGYESLPFSITEDYLLFKAILENGYDYRWPLIPAIVNYSAPIGSWLGLFQQRKRWLKGGLNGPWYALIAFGVFTACYPTILAFIFFIPNPFVFGIGILLLLLDSLFITASSVRLGHPKLVLLFPIFVCYRLIHVTVFPIFALLPFSVVWKGRKY
jgi:cellulose synthase/poly-beta-1,6-N-acetylglucosamine synthase-like glycosyltransferase